MSTILKARMSWLKSYNNGNGTEWQTFRTDDATVENVVEAAESFGAHRHKNTIWGVDLDETFVQAVLAARDENDGEDRLIRAINKALRPLRRKANLRGATEFWHFVHSKDNRFWCGAQSSFNDAVEAATENWGLIAKAMPRIVSKDYVVRQDYKGLIARAYVADRPLNSVKDVVENGRFVGYVEVQDRENDAHDIMSVVMMEIALPNVDRDVDGRLNAAYDILIECGYDHDEAYDWFDEYFRDIDEHCVWFPNGRPVLGGRWPEEIRERQERRAERASA